MLVAENIYSWRVFRSLTRLGVRQESWQRIGGVSPPWERTNHPSLWWFFNKVKRLRLTSLKRRSQRASLNWERFIQFVDRFFPPIRTLHPLPCHRFDVRTRGRSPVR